MTAAAHHQLFHELNAGRFDSPAATEAVAQLGDQGLLLRALARARRKAWSSACADIDAVLARPDPRPPRVEYVMGVASIVARRYSAGLAALTRAAYAPVPAVASYASKIASKFAVELGWMAEAQPLLERAAAIAAPSDLRVRAQALARASASRQRGSDALVGTAPEVAAKIGRQLHLDGIAAATASLDTLLARRGPEPTLLAARARMALLAGELAAAQALLEQAPTEAARAEWAALALARGELAEALAHAGARADTPRLAYLRGEVLLELGDHEAAAEVLERARIAMPSSVPVALALALARHRQDPEGPATELEHRFADLVERAPALLADAAVASAIPLWSDAGLLASRPDAVRVLERARALITEDREPGLAHYRAAPGGPLRQLAPTPRDGPSALTRLHAHDLDWIDKLNSMLVAGAGVDPVGPRGPQRSAEVARPVQPRWLTPAQIEQFLADGYLRVPRAIDPELARRWREDANRRIREEPERWVQGYDPDDPARSLRQYSPDDPATWTWPRLALIGDDERPIDSFAPRAWQAICDLLGGPERIKTRTWSNYMILNFCDPGQGDDVQPAPDWSSWHIDDPHPALRLDRIQNGLVGIALFDDLQPASGNTWLCPDSVARVARELADHPEGVDFVHDRGARITRECQRFVEVVGECGDVFLLHPLLMHSASPNRSGRIRWMGNPMVYMNAPLDPLRADASALSPVELAIRSAIDRPKAITR